MRVLYLSSSGQLGGAEISLLDLLASIRAAKPDWPLRLIVAESGPLSERAAALGVPTTLVPFPRRLARLGDAGAGGPAGHEISRARLAGRLFSAGPAVAGYVRRLRSAIGEFAPDVVHTNGFKVHILAVWARPARTPVVWHVHDYVRSRPVMARLLRRYAGRCAAVIANSRSVAGDVRSVCGDGLLIHAVHNAVDCARFSAVGPVLDLDSRAGLPPAAPGTVKVGLVATMARWKGHDVFLRALSLLPPGLPVRGYVIGGALYQTDGSQYAVEELRRLAAKLGLSHKVGFTGFVAEPAAAMRALGVVVHASTEPEPFGRVIVEAMACGRAVIISRGGGAPELIEDDVDALSHQPGDAALLAEGIARLAADPGLRAKLGGAARATAESRFDRSRLARDVIPIYRDVAPHAV